MEPGELARQLCYVIKAKPCSESNSVGLISTQRGWVKRRFLPGGPCSSGANQQELYIPYLQTSKFYKFKLSSLFFETIRPKDREYKLHATNIS